MTTDTAAGTAVIETVNTFKNTFTELVAFAKSVAPDIWDILVRQQFVEALSITIGFVLILAMVFPCFSVIRKRPEWSLNQGDCVVGWVLTVISIVGSIIMTAVFLTHALPRFLNPAYYALMSLKP